MQGNSVKSDANFSLCLENINLTNYNIVHLDKTSLFIGLEPDKK